MELNLLSKRESNSCFLSSAILFKVLLGKVSNVFSTKHDIGHTNKNPPPVA